MSAYAARSKNSMM